MNWIKRIFMGLMRRIRPMRPIAAPASAPVQPTPDIPRDPKGMLARLAKPSCGKCYGRGFTATMSDGRLVACRCSQNNGKIVLAQAQAIRAAQENKPTM